MATPASPYVVDTSASPCVVDTPASPCVVEVTRPALTVRRRAHLYTYSPHPQPGLRERLCRRARKYGSCSRGRVRAALEARLPILDWLPKYPLRHALLWDMIAGATVGVLSVAQGMGYALMAGLPPIMGLYAAFISGLVYLVMGTSHHISLGAVASLSTLTAKAVGKLATLDALDGPNATALLPDLANTTAATYSPAQVAVALTWLCGLMQALMGALQLGKVFSVLLSPMVISAFTTGVAFQILPSQLKGLLGIAVPRHSGPFKALYTSWDVCVALPSVNLVVVAMSALSVTLLMLNNEILKPRLKKLCLVPLPIELVVVVAGTAASHLLGLEDTHDVDVIGHVPRGLPSPSVPPLELLPQLLLDAFITAMVGYSSLISMAKIAAMRKGYTVNDTQELYALGTFNMVGSFFSCLPMSVALSRSAIQQEVGGVSMVTSLFSTGVVVATLYCIGPLFSTLPKCVLSSVILVSLKGLFLHVNDFLKLWSSSRLDAAIWLTTFVTCVVVDLDYGLVAGVAASAVVLLLRAQRPSALRLGHVPFTDLYLDMDTYHKAVEVPGVKIFQFGGPLHFANASYFHASLYSVTGLDAPSTKAQPGIAKGITVEKPLFSAKLDSELHGSPALGLPESGVRRCKNHAYTVRKDYDRFVYDLNNGKKPEVKASQAGTSQGDVSQDDTSGIDVSQDDANQGGISQEDVSQGFSSQEDVSQDDASQDDASQENVRQGTSSHSHAQPRTDTNTEEAGHRNTSHGGPDQDNAGVMEASRQHAASDPPCPRGPTHSPLSTKGGESTCITLPAPRWLVLDLSLVSFVDSTGANLLTQLHRDLQPAGVTLCLAAASDRVLGVLEACGVLDHIPRNLAFHSTHDAVTAMTCPGPCVPPPPFRDP